MSEKKYRLCEGKTECNPSTCRAVTGECQYFDDLYFTDYEEHPDNFDLYPEDEEHYQAWKNRGSPKVHYKE